MSVSASDGSGTGPFLELGDERRRVARAEAGLECDSTAATGPAAVAFASATRKAPPKRTTATAIAAASRARPARRVAGRDRLTASSRPPFLSRHVPSQVAYGFTCGFGSRSRPSAGVARNGNEAGSGSSFG